MREFIYPILAYSRMGPRNPAGHSFPVCPVDKYTLPLMILGAPECAPSDLPTASNIIKIEKEIYRFRIATASMCTRVLMCLAAATPELMRTRRPGCPRSSPPLLTNWYNLGGSSDVLRCCCLVTSVVRMPRRRRPRTNVYAAVQVYLWFVAAGPELM